VCASAAEAEYGGCFLNGQQAVWLRTVLHALGYPQASPTIILCDNSCAVSIANDQVKLKRSKSVHMRYHWLRDRVRLGELNLVWQKGADNLADFFTKALPIHDHQRLKRTLVRAPSDPDNPSLNNRARRSRLYYARKLAQSEGVHCVG
jgi:hypothetical protein